MLKIRLILLFVSLFVSCDFQKLTAQENGEIWNICGIHSKKQIHRKILNGIKKKPKDSPWVVSIVVRKEDGHISYCTGTLISTRHVLTVRHCFIEDNSKRWITNDQPYDCKPNQEDLQAPGRILRSVDLYFNTECGYEKACSRISKPFLAVKRRPRRIILIHTCRQNQESKFEDDFAIIELDKNVKFSNLIHPVCISTSQVYSKKNLKLRVAGYGSNPSESNNSNGILRYHNVQTVKCFLPIKDWFCTMTSERSVDNTLGCKGDSGAGATLLTHEEDFTKREVLVGLLSKGVSCATATRKSIDWYVPVVKYRRKICFYTGVCQS